MSVPAKRLGVVVGISALIAVLGGWPATAAETFISGLQPDRRPQNAPVVETYEKNNAWYIRAVSGVTQPYPNSLRFLDDQGGWFTPFTRPGMTGLYDIRGFHSRSNTQK